VSSITGLTSHAQAVRTSRPQWRTLLLIAALLLIVTVAALYFGLVAGPFAHQATSVPPAHHLIAGNWADTDAEGLVINPSYFSPVAFREFAKTDNSHDWNGLITQSYADITTASEKTYSNSHWAFLPSNWAVINPKDGSFSAYTKKADSVDYSYDAFRTLYRIAEDYNLNHAPEAKTYLDKITVFQSEWQKSGSICSLYLFSQAGTPCYQNTGTMAGTLGTASVTNRDLAKQVLDKYYLSNNQVKLPDNAAFYEKSWYWFALYSWSDQVLTIK